MPPAAERRLAAILSADVAGYSRLDVGWTCRTGASPDEAQAMRENLRRAGLP